MRAHQYSITLSVQYVYIASVMKSSGPACAAAKLIDAEKRGKFVLEAAQHVPTRPFTHAIANG